MAIASTQVHCPNVFFMSAKIAYLGESSQLVSRVKRAAEKQTQREFRTENSRCLDRKSGPAILAHSRDRATWLQAQVPRAELLRAPQAELPQAELPPVPRASALTPRLLRHNR